MDIVHTSRHISYANRDEILVCQQVAGLATLEQDGRGLTLREGDIVLIDPQLPYAGKFQCPSEMLVLKVPRRALEARLGVMRDMVARHVSPRDSENGLISALLGTLPMHAGELDPTVQEMVKGQVLDLLAVSLSKAMQRQKPRVSCARSLALMKVRAAVETYLSDPALDAEAVAAAAGISVRYANAVLGQDGTSITSLIRTRRLERCRRALEDPSQAQRKVSEIAYGWGFSDMTHFGRRFKAVYGMLPSEYRRRASSD